MQPWDHPSLAQFLNGRADLSPGFLKPQAGACAGCPHSALAAAEEVLEPPVSTAASSTLW